MPTHLWRPRRSPLNIGIMLGRGMFDVSMPALGANEVGRITLDVTFNTFASTRQILQGVDPSGATDYIGYAIRIASNFQTAWVTNKTGSQITPVADTSSFNWAVGQRTQIVIETTRNAGNTAVDMTISNGVATPQPLGAR